MHNLLITHRTFNKVDHVLEHKMNLNKFSKIQVIEHMFSEHGGIKLESNNKEKYFWILRDLLSNP